MGYNNKLQNIDRLQDMKEHEQYSEKLWSLCTYCGKVVMEENIW
jgi:hypothetical protein